MAEKPKDKKDDKKKKAAHHGGGMNFGTEIIIFLVILFIVWAIFGKRTENTEKPFIQQTDTTNFVPQQ